MTEHAIWELESFYGPQDVIIAGSGLAGLWSAFYLKKRRPNWKIALIDRGLILTGASTRNAGFASFGSLTELLADVKNLGVTQMQEIVRMRFRGLSIIRKTFHDIDLDLETHGGYELLTCEQYPSLDGLRRDINWINECLYTITGKKHLFRVADKKLHAFGFRETAYLVENKLEAQLHSGKLVQCLLQKVQSMGVTLLPGMEVIGFEHAGDRVLLHLNTGISMFARQLLVSTNALARQLLPEIDVLPARGQILLTSEILPLPFRGCFHADEGYYYFRNLGNKILLGGARNKAFEEEQTFDAGISDTIQQELERFLREVILPGTPFQVEHRWSGIMGMGSSKLPTVKEVRPSIFCATGMGGMGVAFAPVVGKQVAKLMVGK